MDILRRSTSNNKSEGISQTDADRKLEQWKKVAPASSSMNFDYLVEEENAAEMAMEKRLLNQKSSQNARRWEDQVQDARHWTRKAIIAYYWNKLNISKVGILMAIFFLLAFVFFWIFLGFIIGAPGAATSDGYKIWRIFLLLWLMFIVIVVLYVLFFTINAAVAKILQARLFLQPTVLLLSLTLLCWGIIFFASYRAISHIEGTCNRNATTGQVDNSGGLSTIQNVFGNSVCFSWQWLFLTALVIGVCWFFRNLGEEYLMYRLGITPGVHDISLSLLREYYLHTLCSYMRKHGVIPARSHPDNLVKDLDIKLRSLNEGALLDRLSEDRQKYGRYNDNYPLFKKNLLEKQLRAQAEVMFEYLDSSERGYLLPEDFQLVFPDRPERAFLLFDKDLSGKISKAKFVWGVETAYKNRRNVWDSYLDRKSISDQARSVIGAGFWAVMVVIALVLAGVSLNAVIIPLASFILGFSFAFGGLVTQTVESFYLLLYLRPFDVGDRIKINDGITGYPKYAVNKLNLLQITLFDIYGKCWYFPTSYFKGVLVTNYTRSREYTFSTDLCMSFDTPGGTVLEFKSRMENYFSQNPDVYQVPDVFITISDSQQLNTMVVSFWVPIVGLTWNQWGDFTMVVNEIWLEIQRNCFDLGIQYYAIPNKNYYVSGHAPRSGWKRAQRMKDSKRESMMKEAMERMKKKMEEEPGAESTYENDSDLRRSTGVDDGFVVGGGSATPEDDDLSSNRSLRAAKRVPSTTTSNTSNTSSSAGSQLSTGSQIRKIETRKTGDGEQQRVGRQESSSSIHSPGSSPVGGPMAPSTSPPSSVSAPSLFGHPLRQVPSDEVPPVDLPSVSSGPRDSFLARSAHASQFSSAEQFKKSLYSLPGISEQNEFESDEDEDEQMYGDMYKMDDAGDDANDDDDDDEEDLSYVK